MRSDETPRDWESVVLDRIRNRLEDTEIEETVDVGWESAALERLRAHFEAEG
jgi:hypothetical protein